MRPRELAALALGVPVAEVVDAQQIKHGLTNESWLVRTRTDAVVVRISNTSERALQIDRASECTILKCVAAAGLGAPVVLCDPQRHVLVTRYLGETWTLDDARQGRNIERVGRLLRRLHAQIVPPQVRTVDLIATIDHYLGTLDEHGAQGDLASASLRQRAREAASALRADSPPCLCHNDVHHLNVVDDGELRLIDWEYAGVGERLFDLASACVYHAYSARQREQLVYAYLSGRDASIEQRLTLACWLFEYVRDLWMAVRAIQP